MLVLVLEYLLAIGNYMNRNWSERNVTSGFQVSSIEKVRSLYKNVDTSNELLDIGASGDFRLL